MEAYIGNIVFGCPDPRALGLFYAELLGMRVIREDWFVIAKDDSSFPRLAFDEEADYRPPRWLDPEHPQQLHLDFPVSNLEAAEELAVRLGATPLQDKGDYRSYADPAGHPFCLYRDAEASDQSGRPLPGRIGRVVYDCFSPRALVAFYQQLLGLRMWKQDTERRVEIAWNDSRLPMLAFQHAQFRAPRWPDPGYPQQIHLDLFVDDGEAANELALRLGAIPLPPQGGSCPVYADPASHPFCLCAPGQ
jgi:catechol 2,3-dioxygenase-like lactoylglutathione lyase family enzyme